MMSIAPTPGPQAHHAAYIPLSSAQSVARALVPLGGSRRAVERVIEVQPLLCLAPPLAMSKGYHEQYQIARLCVRSSSAGAELRRLPLASDRSRQLGTRLRRRAEGVGAVRWPWGAESRCRRWPDVPRAPSARIPATGQRRRHPAPAPSGSFRSCCGASGSRPGSWTVEVHTPRRPARASPHAWSTWRRADRGAEARPSGGHCAARSVFAAC